MQTLEIEAILDSAYHKAAGLAAYEVRKHLRPYNLKRHPVTYSRNYGLMVGSIPAYDLHLSRPVIQAIHEAARYAHSLPEPVRARLKDHL